MTLGELLLRRYAVQGLVAEARRIALDYFGRNESLGVTMKGTQDWLTVADGAVEDFLRARLAELSLMTLSSARKAVAKPAMRSGSSIRSTAPRTSPAAIATGASPWAFCSS